MVVKTGSWHYKVWAWSHLVPSDERNLVNKGTSLCPYFWRVMLALAWLPPLATLLVVGKAPYALLDCALDKDFRWRKFHPFHSIHGDWPLFEGLAGLLCSLVLALVFLNLSEVVMVYGWLEVLKIAVGVGILFGVMLVFGVAVILLIAFTIDKYNEIRNAPPRSQLQSLVFSYLSAVKKKICPRIEFQDAHASTSSS
jgi:MFS family permease